MALQQRNKPGMSNQLPGHGKRIRSALQESTSVFRSRGERKKKTKGTARMGRFMNQHLRAALS
jgi:hypothetical protein